MNIFIVYAHPSKDSFTHRALLGFLEGLDSAGHRHVVSDLYAMDFRTDMTEEEYRRESHYRLDLPVPCDVLAEQEKINRSDAIVFIYPVFWTEAPAKLVGWFDRVWTYGFAYGPQRGMKQLEKGLVICIAGRDRGHLDEHGQTDAMKTVMLEDRMHDRVKTRDFVILDSTAKHDLQARQAHWDRHLRTAFMVGANIASTTR
ncbi:MAG: NAD(P)H-dependent oxidoreductase [Xanthomonadaceae bacterium]|jgi:NAD(P)H dehydrogenase (quinone)|nr:NAD(P)H-dependent oxidoreductase [Xanthomonadaceae bacterium]